MTYFGHLVCLGLGVFRVGASVLHDFEQLSCCVGIAYLCVSLLFSGRIDSRIIMSFNLEEFVEAPTLEVFNACSEGNLTAVGEHFKVAVSKQVKRQLLRQNCYML